MTAWSYVLAAFGVDDVWIRCSDDNVDFVAQHSNGSLIASAAELPGDRPLVIMTPDDGRHVQATRTLLDFEHPAGGIYLFGHDHLYLDPEDDLGGRTDYQAVSIPSGGGEIFSYQAAGIVLYDVMAKAHG